MNNVVKKISKKKKKGGTEIEKIIKEKHPNEEVIHVNDVIKEVKGKNSSKGSESVE